MEVRDASVASAALAFRFCHSFAAAKLHVLVCAHSPKEKSFPIEFDWHSCLSFEDDDSQEFLSYES